MPDVAAMTNTETRPGGVFPVPERNRQPTCRLADSTSVSIPAMNPSLLSLFPTPCLAVVLLSHFPAVGGEVAPRLLDFTDPTYGGRVRQIVDPAGDEHNLYHYRNVFNADGSRRLGIETPAGSKDYHVTLYDADGQRIKRLFTQADFDWRVAWDRQDPRVFYTWKADTVYRCDVATGSAEPLRTFAKPGLAPTCGLSLNQQGDRLLLLRGDRSVRTYRLPDLEDEVVCRIDIPQDGTPVWDKLRFTGHKDCFALTFEPRQAASPGAPRQRPFTRIYDGATGRLLHTLQGVTAGHHDFSPDGRMAYVEGYFNQGPGMRLHVVNVDGTEDRVVFTAPREQLRYVRNYHITWPAGVNDWFLLSFFPQSGRLPPDYEPWLDEIVQVFVDGRHRVLARTGTTCGANFWTQPQQSVSADGRRVLFHSNGECRVGRIGQQASGTLDSCLLFLD